MNEIINKFPLAGDKFMSEMSLRQPGFTQSACGRFTKKTKKGYENLTNHKPNKILVDKSSEFCNKSMKSWLEKKGK